MYTNATDCKHSKIIHNFLVSIKCAQANLNTFSKALILRKYTNLLVHTLLTYLATGFLTIDAAAPSTLSSNFGFISENARATFTESHVILLGRKL